MSHDRRLPNFSRYPMLWLAAAFAVGILVSSAVDINLWSSVAVAALFALVAAATRGRPAATFVGIAAFAAAGICAAVAENRSVAPDRIRELYDAGTIHTGDPVEVEGVLIGRPEQSFDGSFLTLRADSISYQNNKIKTSGNIRLFVAGTENQDAPAGAIDLRYGSRIRVACRLSREDAYLDPGVIPRRQVLDRQGIDAAGVVKSRRLIEKLADESVFLPLAWIYDQRSRLIDAFRANLSPRAAGVMIASILGDKYFLDKQTADLFRDGGTFHILVISGLHITFIGGLLLLLIRLCTRSRWAQFIVTATVLWAYTLAVGAEVPVVRASLMFTVGLYTYALYRSSTMLNSLGICALLLLVWRPADLFDPSFQLTFVSVAAIVLTAYPLLDALRRIGSWMPSSKAPFPPNVPKWLKSFAETLYWNPIAWSIESKNHVWTARIFKSPFVPKKIAGGLQRAVRYVFEAALVSLIVQLWMLPLSVVYFHRVSVSSVILNLWVGAFIAVESVAAVVGALISSVSVTVATAFFTIAELADLLMMLVPRLFSDNGIASFRLPAYAGPGTVMYFLYIIPLAIIAYMAHRWRPFDLIDRSAGIRRILLRPAVGALVVSAAIIVFHPYSSPRPDGRLHFDFLDVGQGDSALVTFPDGTTLLIDGGGRVNYRAAAEDGQPFVPDTRGVGEAVVSEFLWQRGYSRVDHILATHADADHIQGLADVAKNFAVGSAVFGRTPPSDPEFVELAEVLRKRGIPMETISRGETMQIGGVIVDVLYPESTGDANAVSDNDHSVVLRFRMGDRSILMTGDIERPAETSIVASGEQISADLIKVPHHGSRTSSTREFIDAVHPKLAIISVGRTSPFGHPHKDVIDRWLASGAEVMTTGERGMVSVSTDGRDMAVETFQK